MITLFIVVGLLGTISLLAMVWVWVSVLAGWREASPGKSLSMLWFVLLLMIIWGLGVNSSFGGLGILALAAWPASILFLMGIALTARLFVFVFAALILLFLVAAVTLIMPGKAKVPTIIVGAMLTVLGPVALQDLQVQWQMKRNAKTSELRIIERSSLFKSIRERSDGYQSPHGVACSSENWPFLWSYRHRDWIALPSNTRYGGDTRERVMSVCLSS